MESPPQPSSLNLKTTQTLQHMIDAEEKKSRFFLLRRRPMANLQREWTRPSDEEYARQLMAEGFVTQALLGRAMSDELAADVRELDQHLLPHFWRANQLAKYYQNRYYQYQWAFIISAFLTTALAAVNIFLHTQANANTSTSSGILGFATAIASGIAAAVSFLDANQTPQKRWYKARAQAEGLRSLYFLFLARQHPFDTSSDRERVHRMRQKVIDVLRSAGGGVRIRTSTTSSARPTPRPAGTPSAPQPPTAPPLATPPAATPPPPSEPGAPGQPDQPEQ
jgi:hypothetical protein